MGTREQKRKAAKRKSRPASQAEQGIKSAQDAFMKFLAKADPESVKKKP